MGLDDFNVEKLSSEKDVTKPQVGDRIWRPVDEFGEYIDTVDETFKLTEGRGDHMFRAWYEDQSKSDRPAYRSKFGPSGYHKAVPHDHENGGMVCIVSGNADIDRNWGVARVRKLSKNENTAFAELYSVPRQVLVEVRQGHIQESNRKGVKELRECDTIKRGHFGELKYISDQGMYRFWLKEKHEEGKSPLGIVERDVLRDATPGDPNWRVVDIYDAEEASDEKIAEQIKSKF